MSWMDTFSQLTGFDFSGSTEKLSTSPDPIQTISQTSATQTTTPAAQSYGVSNTPANSTNDSYNKAISDINRHIVDIWSRENLYPQKLGSGSERSDADIWKHLDVHVWGRDYVDEYTGEVTAANPTAIKPFFQQKFEDVYATRRTKKEVEQILIDYYGDDIARLNEGHARQEERISERSPIGHSHNGTNGLDWYIKLALVIAGAFLVYFIIRRKFLR
jgi:hypothetical protein